MILDRGEHLDYDTLILACGAETSYFGNDAWRDVPFGLKSLTDAVALRNRIFEAFEEAERTDDPAARERWMTFVVVGGGPTGVEIAGQLAILSRHALRRNFSRIDPANAKVSAIGDAKSLAGKDGKPLPGLATVAIQQGRHVANTWAGSAGGGSRC